MILRVLRARVINGEEANLASFVRDEAVPAALGTPGMLSFQPAVRQSRAGTELVIVSTWSGFDSITAAGRELDAPLSMPGLAAMVSDGHAEHYELVIGEARSMPLREAKLRLTRIPIRQNAEAEYYRAMRDWSERLLDETGLVAFTLGRRVVGQQDEIVAVQVWQDEAALIDATGGLDPMQPMGRDILSRFWAAAPSIEQFDALTAIEPKPDAPALLLTDDNRRYVHATPAAARLAGRPLARLLTMRVEDLTREPERAGVPEAFNRLVSQGSLAGPYALARPDGSSVEIRFAARANAPWPGTHASVLVPAELEVEPEDLDVDKALVEAGFIARYAPA